MLVHRSDESGSSSGSRKLTRRLRMVASEGSS
jgi:hypothetical protein